jgi:hypothetical protein
MEQRDGRRTRQRNMEEEITWKERKQEIGTKKGRKKEEGKRRQQTDS